MVKNILVLDDGTEIAAGTVGQNAILSLTCTETVSKTTDLCPGAACSNKLEITIWVEPGTDLPITSRDPADPLPGDIRPAHPGGHLLGR